MVIDIAKPIIEHIRKLTDRVIPIDRDLSVFGSAETRDLARLKKLCKEYLEYPLVKALNED